METTNLNPFENEKPKLVHLEKDESHYEYCRMQMHEIERTHKRTFICNMALCILVCFLAVFRKYIAGFDLLSTPLNLDSVRGPGAILAGGIFQIIIAMIVIVLGYLAWANFHMLNIILEAWYAIVTVIGVVRLDYLSALVGIVGAVFYFFSIREMRREQALSEMEGYPEFQEKFDISKSDIVIQTLLAHQGEHRTKSTLFTTDYSLRKKKKTPNYYKNGNSLNNKLDEKAEGAAGQALVETLQKQLSEVRDARETRTAVASLEAVAAEQTREKNGVSLKDMAILEDVLPEEAAETAAAETAALPEEKPEPAAVSKDSPVGQERADAEAAAAAILAEAEAKAQAILAAAEAKAKELEQQSDAALSAASAPAAEETAAAEEAPAAESDAPAAEPPKPAKPQNAQGGGNSNANRRRKKKKH